MHDDLPRSVVGYVRCTLGNASFRPKVCFELNQLQISVSQRRDLCGRDLLRWLVITSLLCHHYPETQWQKKVLHLPTLTSSIELQTPRLTILASIRDNGIAASRHIETIKEYLLKAKLQGCWTKTRLVPHEASSTAAAKRRDRGNITKMDTYAKFY